MSFFYLSCCKVVFVIDFLHWCTQFLVRVIDYAYLMGIRLGRPFSVANVWRLVIEVANLEASRIVVWVKPKKRSDSFSGLPQFLSFFFPSYLSIILFILLTKSCKCDNMLLVSMLRETAFVDLFHVHFEEELEGDLKNEGR